jgi:alkanesulfonate monooxygenase SsuD/methylene tetrahydromethanopterin reductase-like flavin-dependent oxidoreductase (luciferase family)
MIGGGGERKTLRLVAQYGDAANVFGGPVAIHHKYEVLRRHCEEVGRGFDEIERSTLQSVNLATESPASVVDRFGELSDAGAQHVIFSLRDVHDLRNIEAIGRDVAPQLRDL